MASGPAVDGFSSGATARTRLVAHALGATGSTALTHRLARDSYIRPTILVLAKLSPQIFELAPDRILLRLLEQGMHVAARLRSALNHHQRLLEPLRSLARDLVLALVLDHHASRMSRATIPLGSPVYLLT
jgi:hypothetical protein